MKHLFCSITILLAIASSYMSAGEPSTYLFRMLDTSTGLPDNNVRGMTMLPNGIMCIQTSSMLCLYDGSSCHSYRFNAAEIPYTEYSGMNKTYYDSSENILWCVTRDHIWVFNLTTRKYEYDISPRLKGMGLADIKPVGLHIDPNGTFWLDAGNGYITSCNTKTGTVKSISLPQGMESTLLFANSGNRLWIMSMSGHIAEYDPLSATFRTLKKVPVNTIQSSPSRMDIDITSDGKVWIMYDKDIVLYDKEKDLFKNICSISQEVMDIYTTIELDNGDNLWVGTARSGVSIIEESGAISTLPYLEMPDGKKIYHHTDISDIFIDDRGGVWIATLSEGLLYWHKDIIRISTINNDYLSRGGMTDESVKCMIEDKDGTILIGTIHGLLRYDPVTKEMSLPYEALKDELCISLYHDRNDNLWVGTFYNGAYRIDRKGRIRHYCYKDISVDISYHESKPNFNSVRSFHEDSEGNFWISVYGGVGLFNPVSGEIRLLRETHPELGRFMIIRDICERKDGLLLMSGDNGRFIYDPAEDKVYTNPESEKCHTRTHQALIDKNGCLWMATADGIHMRDMDSGKDYSIRESAGLPASDMMSLVSDNLGNIWASSFSYISRIRSVIQDNGEYVFSVSTFGREDGVESGAFFQGSVLAHSNGHLYFGGGHGICEIIPERFFQEQVSETPLITSFYLYGKHIDVGEEYNGRIILTNELDKMKKIELRHDESFITLLFSNLNYANPSHTTYLYKLENFDKEWQRISSQSIGKAQYTYLEPGSYTFMVKAADNDMGWNSTETLDIVIQPPFYKSVFAYIMYIILGITLSSLIIYTIYKRSQKKMLESKEQEERRQKEELDQMKFQFFTNISHELRTPLSLIILPLESIIKSMEDSPLLSKLKTMHSNALQLLSLVNHLLDFRKMEMGGEKLHLTKGDIGEFVGASVASFMDAAQKNGITLIFENCLENPIMSFDSSQMQKITNNLLSNALKFTPEGGFINVRIETNASQMMVLEVTDTGIGIPKKDIEFIFNRFYRSGNTDLRTGSGIGLSLVKQYVEMHSGTISVKSEIGKGTTFTVHIPIDLKSETKGREENENMEQEPVHEVERNKDTDNRRHVMVVDDNVDFREYLVGELSEYYNVYSAEDGKECLKKLKHVNPDVVICDVMMPNLDGFGVVKAIKSNINTSHIPIILLSARTSEAIRLEGYETGADAYMTKPFKLDILLARVKNLIEERNRRIASFSKVLEISPSEVTITTIDQKLMTRIMDSIEKNMDNSEYSVEDLSADVGMHRMNLYRKLQSIAGMTPSEFIRTMRLKRAAQLLQNDPNLTVSEVSDMVGFNTSKYFTKYFKDLFGVTPSQYR